MVVGAGTDGMSADPQTPARRAATAGGSPVAKRLRAPQEAEVTDGSELNASQMSQAIHQLRAQAVMDHQWMQVVEETVTQHAEVIDDARMKATRLKADTDRVDAERRGLAEEDRRLQATAAVNQAEADRLARAASDHDRSMLETEVQFAHWPNACQVVL